MRPSLGRRDDSLGALTLTGYFFLFLLSLANPGAVVAKPRGESQSQHPLQENLEREEGRDRKGTGQLSLKGYQIPLGTCRQCGVCDS